VKYLQTYPGFTCIMYLDPLATKIMVSIDHPDLGRLWDFSTTRLSNWESFLCIRIGSALFEIWTRTFSHTFCSDDALKKNYGSSSHLFQKSGRMVSFFGTCSQTVYNSLFLSLHKYFVTFHADYRFLQLILSSLLMRKMLLCQR
jgi:hypothetical protein